MYIKILVYVFHLLIVFPYLFHLGRELKKDPKYKDHSQVLIASSIMGFGYQLYLLINLILLLQKL